MTEDSILLVLSNANAGAEDAYRDWYRERHLSDMVAIDGVDGGAIHERAEGGDAPRWRFAALYELNQPAGDILAEVFGRAGGPAMELTDTIDAAGVLMLAAEPVGPRRLARPDADQGDALRYIVLTNAGEGEEDEFNAWYDGRHLADVLAIPGFVAAQRFRIAAETAGKSSPWRYLSIYELAPEAATKALAELAARAGSEAMPLSAALDRSSVLAELFLPLRELPA